VGGLTRGIVHSNSGANVSIDYRIYAPHSDGKTQKEHFIDMNVRAIAGRRIKAKTVHFDSKYASMDN
jgi:hypothetical protein